MTTEADNVRRGLAGTYEVWYLTWNDPKDGTGYWLRHVIEPSYAEVWFAAFPTSGRSPWGVHKRYAGAESHDAPFSVSIGDAVLRHDGATGSLRAGGHEVAWDLRWQPAPKSFKLLPNASYSLGIGETTVISPNPRVIAKGTLKVDGVACTVDGAVIGQTHVWGTKHSYSWTWARCGELDGCDGMLELFAGRLQRFGQLTPPLVLCHYVDGSTDLELNQLRHIAVNRAEWDIGKVRFVARGRRYKIEGEFTCAPDRMVNAPYLDPDGTRVFCANTEAGDAKISIFKRSALGWQETRHFDVKGKAHFEIGGRTKDPRVRNDHATIE